MVDKNEAIKDYSSKNVKVLEGLESIRKQFDVSELSKNVKRQGDILTLSQELKINYSSLKRAVEEGRILQIFPSLNKSKVLPLSRLKTERDFSEFSRLNDLDLLSTREIYKRVKHWNVDLQKNPRDLLNREEHDLIIGSLLGDASIRKRLRNSCFRVAHSVKQEEYAKYKQNVLRIFGTSEYTEKERIIKERTVKMFYFSTRTHPVFNYYRNLFYNSGRKQVTREILSQLNPSSLAIWICDDGSYETKQGYIILCTNSYSKEEHSLMKKFFNEKFGLNPTIGFRDGKYYYLRFKQDDSKKLIEIVRPFIPESMKYKIGEKND